LRGFFMIYPFC